MIHSYWNVAICSIAICICRVDMSNWFNNYFTLLSFLIFVFWNVLKDLDKDNLRLFSYKDKVNSYVVIENVSFQLVVVEGHLVEGHIVGLCKRIISHAKRRLCSKGLYWTGKAGLKHGIGWSIVVNFSVTMFCSCWTIPAHDSLSRQD